jgi:hypothetical protein
VKVMNLVGVTSYIKDVCDVISVLGHKRMSISYSYSSAALSG